LTQFFGYWLAIRPVQGLLPGRQHFDPLAIPKVMPRLWLLDVVREAGTMRFRYRLVGTKEVETLQREVTGQCSMTCIRASRRTRHFSSAFTAW